ncbi:MAG: hypothetical protein ACXABG_09710, partial [Promethearchaeota archaeon]
MVKIVGQSGALTYLLAKLNHRNRTYHFDSLKSVSDFKKDSKVMIENYKNQKMVKLIKEIENQTILLQECITTYDLNIEEREKFLRRKMEDYRRNLDKYSEETNPIKKLYFNIKRKKIIQKLNSLETNFDSKLHSPYKNLKENIETTKREIANKENNFDKIIKNRSKPYVSKIQKKLNQIDELNPYFLGALGELKVIEELKTLPDNFYVINNLSLNFK